MLDATLFHTWFNGVVGIIDRDQRSVCFQNQRLFPPQKVQRSTCTIEQRHCIRQDDKGRIREVSFDCICLLVWRGRLPSMMASVAFLSLTNWCWECQVTKKLPSPSIKFLQEIPTASAKKLFQESFYWHYSWTKIEDGNWSQDSPKEFARPRSREGIFKKTADSIHSCQGWYWRAG